MILLISPAKTLDFDAINQKKHTLPTLLEESTQLVGVLKKKSAEDLKQLMKVSDKIADLNVARFNSFETPFTRKNAKQAIYAFRGDVYTGLDADSFDQKDLTFAQKHLRILSGLYGVLRPLDLMQPYRLEMGTKLSNGFGKNLYEFWDSKITNQINAAAGKQPIINLASNEYFKSVKTDQLKGDLYTANFKEYRDGKWKIIAFNAKKARGMMCHYVIKNKLTKPEELVGFNYDNYVYNESLSDERNIIFTR